MIIDGSLTWERLFSYGLDSKALQGKTNNGAEILSFLGMDLQREVHKLEAVCHEGKKITSANSKPTFKCNGRNTIGGTHGPGILAMADALARALPRQMFTGEEILRLVDRSELEVLKEEEEKDRKQEMSSRAEVFRPVHVDSAKL